jgi:hypothetical protein
VGRLPPAAATSPRNRKGEQRRVSP